MFYYCNFGKDGDINNVYINRKDIRIIVKNNGMVVHTYKLPKGKYTRKCVKELLNIHFTPWSDAVITAFFLKVRKEIKFN